MVSGQPLRPGLSELRRCRPAVLDRDSVLDRVLLRWQRSVFDRALLQWWRAVHDLP